MRDKDKLCKFTLVGNSECNKVQYDNTILNLIYIMSGLCLSLFQFQFELK